MPRRYAKYLEEFQVFHEWSTYGAFLLGFGLFIALGVLIHSLLRGRQAPENPWGGATLEWQCSSPPPYYNFHSAPAVNDPYNYKPLVYHGDAGWEYIHPQEPQSPHQPTEKVHS
jgi:cytochrome c oxidase subunit 1